LAVRGLLIKFIFSTIRRAQHNSPAPRKRWAKKPEFQSRAPAVLATPTG
jgi:hypothetical protein